MHLINPGYFVLPVLWSMEKPFHTLCGVNEDSSAMCPNCEKPLLRFLELRFVDKKLRDFPIKLSRLPLYFCWRCALSRDVFTYKLFDDGFSIKILHCLSGSPIEDFPYKDYPLSFPAVDCRLVQLSDDDQSQIEIANKGSSLKMKDCFGHLNLPRHQVGGVPYLVQGADILKEKQMCPECNKEFTLLCSIGDSNFTKGGFTNDSFVQVLYLFCFDCSIASCYQAAD